MAKVRNFAQGPILSRMIMFALPLIATGVLQQLFNTADTVVVGRWGGDTAAEREIALAAVGSCGSLINLIINLFFGMAVGAGVCVAHDIGAGLHENVSRTVQTSMVASVLCGVVLMVIGLLTARPLLALMGTEVSVLDEAVPYMCAYFCGIPAQLVYNYCAAMLRSSGDTTRPLIFLSVAGVVNMVLNCIMVIVFRTGALGVGIATAASQWVSCILIVVYMIRYDGVCRIELKMPRVYKNNLIKMVKIGLPAGLTGTFFSFSNVILQSSINSFGPTVVAGNTAAGNLESYIYMAQNSIYQTVLTFVGQNAGASRFDRVKRVIVAATALTAVIGIVLGWLMILFGRPLLGIFAPDSPEVVEMGMVRLRVICSVYVLCGLMETGCGIMRGLGYSTTAMFVSLIGSCGFRVIWIYTVFAAFPTLPMLYAAIPVCWAITASVHYITAGVALRKKMRKEAAA